MRPSRARGQSLVETTVMIFLLTLMISAILQIFLVHNYAFQMANNAYYSLFKDRAYRHNTTSDEFHGYPNYYRKPLRAVRPWPAGGRVHRLAGSPTNWSEDDRASVPMMPFYEQAIVDQMKAAGITRDRVRLKIGQHRTGASYLDMKFLFIGAGTKGDDIWAVFRMLESLWGLTRRFGREFMGFTQGYDSESLGSQFEDLEAAVGVLGSEPDSGATEELRGVWRQRGGDFGLDTRKESP
ncbi:MAG: hypothetical protein ACRD1X_07805 [Vicinamibacteria bacterium]